MNALKLLLTVAGVLLLAAAVAIPLYGLWIRIRIARQKSKGEEITGAPGEIMWRLLSRWCWWPACRCWLHPASW